MRARAFAISVAMSMVTATAVTGPARAQQCLEVPNQKCVLEQALMAAQSIKDEFWRDSTLGEMAEALAKAGKVTEASLAAQPIGDENRRSEALGGIADAQVKAGKIAEALNVAQSIKDGRSRDRALGVIAEAQAKAGDMEEAQAVARSIRDESLRASALGSVAEAQPTAANIEEALRVAASIKATPLLFDLLAGTLVRAGKKDMLAQFARSIKDKGSRARARSGIASALAKSGDVTEALQVSPMKSCKPRQSATSPLSKQGQERSPTR
jgi:tetratricopeptide (TPR) repeat protein